MNMLRYLMALAILCGVIWPASASAGDVDGPKWTGESSWDIPGEYVVDFHDDVARSAIETVLSSLGLTFSDTTLAEDTRIELVTIPASSAKGVVGRWLAKLRADPRVEGVEPHARVRALFVPDDPLFDKQWHMSRVGAEAAWAMSVGRGVTVAVVDTGIACENFDKFTKASDLAQTKCVAGRNLIKNNSHANDDQGHGTHVAGTIAQSTHNGLGAAGLAFHARLMPVKVLNANGWGTTSAVADGIRWAADHGAQVINLSLGGPRDSRILRAAVRHARDKGAIVVAAAGNSGGAVGYPGGTEGVIGVSATDNADALAWFSSRGQGVDIAAPGVAVVQQTICDRGRNRCEIFPAYNGTSMAAPHVAGAAALLVGLGVSDADAVERILADSAKRLDGDADGAKFGAGLLQVGEAVDSVVRTQTIARLIALLLLTLLAFRWAGRRGETHSPVSVGYWLGALTTGVGLLFFGPWLMSRHHWWLDLLSRPFGEWDLLLDASLHGFLPLANAAVPIGLIVVLMGVKRANPWLAGVCVGTAAYLTALVGLGQLSTPFGWLLTCVWCVANALLCLYVASLLLAKRS